MFAKAGQRGITLNDSPACLADLHILEARALGALGEGNAATQAVAKAEQTFQHVKPENEPEWARFIDPAYIFGEAAHCFRDLGDPDQIDRFATESASEAHRQRRARRGALSHAALAISLIKRNEPEAAASKGVEVIDLATSVNSSRCLETVRDLKRRLKPFAHLPQVQAFNTHAHAELGLPV